MSGWHSRTFLEQVLRNKQIACYKNNQMPGRFYFCFGSLGKQDLSEINKHLRYFIYLLQPTLHHLRVCYGLRPGSSAVLHMSRSEVRRLTQLSSTDFNWSGWGVPRAWSAVNKTRRPTSGQMPIFMSRTKRIIKGLAPFWLYLQKPLTNKNAFVICLV